MSAVKTIVNFSDNESSILNLKIGRCVSDIFDEEELHKQIIENEYDLCRLTVSATDEDTIAKLEKTGLPYFYSGSITRYKTPIADLSDRTFINKGIEYEQYDGSQTDLLLKMLIGTWGIYPIGYYRTPYLRQLITKEKEILCVFEYYKKNNLQKKFPNNSIMFMKHNGNYVGFFALNIIEDCLESHIGGILEPYREGGYFYDTQEYMRTFCIANNLKYFGFGARNENRRVNFIFQKFGYHAVGADNVFHIVPFLSFSKNGKIIHSIVEITDEDTSAVYSKLLDIVKKNAIDILENNNLRFSFNINYLSTILPGKYDIVILFPVISEIESKITIKFYNTEKVIIGYGYLIVKFENIRQCQ